MAIIEFPTPAPRPRITAEELASRLLEKVEAGAEALLRRMVEMNPEFWRRLAEPKGVVVAIRAEGRP
ncbi:MAG TPA: hypothetical protein VIF40_12980 [Methylosinus sp.]|jgi:hypothetical protein|uniref:hypothetical protein n=1 Tax=Methylosinus sp. TaxID=427 RepID=UPI002F950B22